MTIHQDAIKLLKECNAGVKMGIDSIAEILDHVQDDNLKQILNSCREEHQKIDSEVHQLLNRYDESGKEPNAVAKGMSWLKTNMKMSMNESDNTIADLITDGCNMGVKSLNRYLNEYQAADEQAKDIAKKLIYLEQQMVVDISPYL